MKSWSETMAAADELSRRTGVRHKVYRHPGRGSTWYLMRLERLDDAYARHYATVAAKFRKAGEAS